MLVNTSIDKSLTSVDHRARHSALRHAEAVGFPLELRRELVLDDIHDNKDGGRLRRDARIVCLHGYLQQGIASCDQ